MISLILIIIVALEHLLFGYIEMFGAPVYRLRLLVLKRQS